MRSGPFEAVKLEFIRQRLNTLDRDRQRRALTAAEQAEYHDLCARELTQLANAPIPKGRTARSRRRS